MIRAFIDSSVLYAACHSHTGSSREIIREASSEAQANGLTPEILQEILDDQ